MSEIKGKIMPETKHYEGAEEMHYEGAEELQGEITAETIFRQCILMSNDKILADCSFNAHVKAIVVLVCDTDKDRYKPFYDEVYYYDMESKSLADIYQDLIAIEYEHEQKMSSEVKS